jgi:hypothetical protein
MLVGDVAALELRAHGRSHRVPAHDHARWGHRPVGPRGPAAQPSRRFDSRGVRAIRVVRSDRPHGALRIARGDRGAAVRARPLATARSTAARVLESARPEPPRARAPAYVRLRDDHTVERVYEWRIDARGLRTSGGYGGEHEQHFADELFLAGPPTPHAPAWHRAHLRALLCAAQKPEGALAIDEGFRSICYRAIARREWSWDRNDQGESFASLAPGAVTLGYQYGHDYGTTTFVPERALSEPWSTRISLGWPESVREQAREALRSAGEERPLLDASVSECAEVYTSLGPKLHWDARWARGVALDFEGFEAVRHERQWRESAAFGLFAALEFARSTDGRRTSCGCRPTAPRSSAQNTASARGPEESTSAGTSPRRPIDGWCSRSGPTIRRAISRRFSGRTPTKRCGLCGRTARRTFARWGSGRARSGRCHSPRARSPGSHNATSKQSKGVGLDRAESAADHGEVCCVYAQHG